MMRVVAMEMIGNDDSGGDEGGENERKEEFGLIIRISGLCSRVQLSLALSRLG